MSVKWLTKRDKNGKIIRFTVPWYDYGAFLDGGGGFSPTELSGLLAWYDASDDSTITLNGPSAVSELKDKSYTTPASRPENLLLQSETFNTTWTRAGITAFSSSDSGGPGSGSFANTTRSLDPFGGNNADFIQESGSTGQHYIIQSFTALPSGSYKYSIYVKPTYRTVIATTINNINAYFRLIDTGSVLSYTVDNASITLEDNDFYLCSITCNNVNPNSVYLYSTSGSGTINYTGDNTSGLFIYGAQLRRVLSSFADYVATTTLPEYAEHSLLQSTAAYQPIKSRSDNKANLLVQSETFDAWTQTYTSTTPNAIANPVNGELTAELVTEDNTAGVNHRIGTSTGWPGISGSFVATIYYKPNGRPTFRYRWGGGTSVSTYFQCVDTGSILAGSGTITALADGWYLCTMTSNWDGTSTGMGMWFAVDGTTTTTYDGDGTSGAYVYAASIRPVSCDSDYIQTTAVPAYPGLNGRSVLIFDGTNDYMAMAAQNLDLPLTIITVFRQITWTDNDKVFASIGGGQIYQRTTSPLLRMYSLPSGGTIDNSDLTIGSWGICTSVFKGNNSWVNINNGTVSTGNIGTGNFNSIYLGSNVGGSDSSNIEFAEMLIYNRELTAVELNLIKAYLANKWTIVL